jgi:ATP-dependent protease HslVU (ClpYQ) peptidase subunit
MTCIVGMEFQDRVYIAGDIQGTGWNYKVVHTTPKVFSKCGVVFGYTTSYRFGQVLEHNLQDPVIPHGEAEIYRWLITVLIPDVRAVLKETGYEKGGNCLIGVKNQLWELQDDFSVLRSVTGYSAVGSGCEYALGSLFTSNAIETPGNADDVKQLLKRAIRTAGTFSPSVGTDSTVLST